MERRLFAWVVASTAFLFIYISLNRMFAPPLPPQEIGEDFGREEFAEEMRPAIDDLLADDNDVAIKPLSAAKPQWTTLGSFDPESGYHMLVYLNNRGAGIERIELTERNRNGRLRYRRVDVTGGYLGYLALRDRPGLPGPEIQVVGPGTPAAEAKATASGGGDGLVAGDCIVQINDQPVAVRRDLESSLRRYEPGTKVRVKVMRPIASDAAAEISEDPENAEGREEPEEADEVDEADEAEREVFDFVAVLSEQPLDLLRLSSRGGVDEIEGNLDRLSCLVSLSRVGNLSLRPSESTLPGLPSQTEAIWSVRQDAQERSAGEQAEFRLPMNSSGLQRVAGGSLELVRRYAIQPGSYLIDMEVQIENQTSSTQQLAYRVEGPNGLSLEGWWYSTKISRSMFSGAGARDLIYKNTGSQEVLWSPYDLLKEARKKQSPAAKVLISGNDPNAERELYYIGVDSQYFTVAFLPVEGKPYLTEFETAVGTLVSDIESIPRHQERAANSSFFLDSETVEVAAGQSLRHQFRLFAGPKDEGLMETHGLSSAIYYGWFPWVAKPLQWLLHALKNNLVFNYALAIVLLTLLVRLSLFPLGRRAALHAQKMQELAPELKKIADKYKDDMEGRLKAQRELQQRVGFNPLSGCLPMLIQLPIFMGLYRCLSVDIELRQAELYTGWQWCSNLAAPDMLYHWGDWLWEYLSGRGTGWLGPYFNILPMIVMGLFLLQQKLFMPPATDEQTAMTQKVMTYMMIFMGFLFFRVPSGLCIYFITSSLWGIAERKLVKNTLPPKPEGGYLSLGNAVADTGSGKTTAAAQGKPGSKDKSLADRINERFNPPPAKALPAAKRPRPKSKKRK